VTHWPMIGIAAPVLLTLAGCGGTDDTIVCTAEARASVVVQVVDAAGAPLGWATVSYRVDSGPVLAAQCYVPPDGCSTFVAGMEVAGEFAIRAKKAGFQSAAASFTVQRDVCHVTTREAVMTLVRGT
jgi:hypothetical protein